MALLMDVCDELESLRLCYYSVPFIQLQNVGTDCTCRKKWPDFFYAGFENGMSLILLEGLRKISNSVMILIRYSKRLVRNKQM